MVMFYQNVLILTNTYSSYLNLMLELEHKHETVEGEDAKPLEPIETEATNSLVQQVRLEAHKTFIQYQCIKDQLKNTLDKKSEEKMDKAYEKIKTEFVINREALKDYVVFMNRALVSEVIESVLRSSNQIVSQVYSDDGSQLQGSQG